MTATDYYKAGQLPEAIDAQIQVVKANPGDHAKRLFLFELLAFAGDLDRAQRQIEAVQYDELERDTAVLAFRKLLDAERQRRRLFAEGLKPEFLVEPPAHVQLRLDALNCLRSQRPAEAGQLLARADQAVPALKGQLNGKSFDHLRDGDDLFAPILEVMAHGQYYWVPLEQIESLAMNPPKFPRDLLWVSARLEMANTAGDVFLPALYPNSHLHQDNQVKLGRMTDWQGDPDGPVRGVGLRTFLVGEDPSSILEWRQLQIG